MSIYSLTYDELVRMLKAYTAFFLVLFGIYFGFREWFEWKVTVLQMITASFTVATIAFGFAAKEMKWTHPKLAKYLGRAIIHGIWYGKLSTNFKRDGTTVAPIDIVFVIKQTYLSISITSYTATMDGQSNIEALLQNVKNDTTRLVYLFELKRMFQGENKLTAGAGELKLQENGTRLKGHYWTNSPTQGDLDLRLVERDFESLDSFEQFMQKYKTKI